MTEYEAYDTVMSIASESFSLLFGYFSLLFAFLVMSYMAAKKLSSQLVVVVIGLYTLASAVININFYALNVDLDNLYVYMMEQKFNGTYDLSWFGMNPPWVPQLLTFLQVLLGVGGYFGSVFFFFHTRKRES
ncbi:MAG: ABC-type cobalamin transport system permease subunit [Candidatus Azotimanducaceae bacterium]|jgi:ABC-type cobalamin transport system permease subunit